MAGQLFAASTQGAYTYSPLLTKEVVHAAQPDMKFCQFNTVREQWGKNAGETFLFDKYGNIDTAGGDLTETSTIPAHSYRLYQSTATLAERGNSIPWTRKYEVLSQTDERKAPVTILKNDMAKVLDTKCEEEFDKCKIRYVGTATGGGVFTTNGTATATCTSQLTLYHVKQIVDYMYQTMKAEPYDNQNYIAIVSSDAARQLYDEVESILQYTKYPASGEFGRFYDVRFVRPTMP
jgi:N4-gp56 family major capsid protein